MTDVRFYHLTRTRLEDALPVLLGRTLERGGRAVVRLATPARLKALDEWLWTFDDAAFIPHGSEGAQHAADQPVWLTLSEDNPRGRAFCLLARGRSWPDLRPLKSARCCSMAGSRRPWPERANSGKWSRQRPRLTPAEKRGPSGQTTHSATGSRTIAAAGCRRSSISLCGSTLTVLSVSGREEDCAWEGRRPRSGPDRIGARHRLMIAGLHRLLVTNGAHADQ